MIGCNNCAGLSLTENLGRGNKYLMLDTHFTKPVSIKSLDNAINHESEIEDRKDNSTKDIRQSDCSPKIQHLIVSNINAFIKEILEGNK